MLKIKKTWKECTNKEILKIYNEVMGVAKSLYPEYFTFEPKLYIDSSTKHLGHCTWQLKKDTIMSKFGFKNHFEYLRYEDAAIILSKYVVDPKVAKRVIIHEFGHFLTPSEHHSYFWERRTQILGEKLGEKDLKRLASIDDSEIFNKQMEISGVKKLEVVCTGCGRIAKRTRMCDIIRHPERWKCGVCGSHFKNV